MIPAFDNSYLCWEDSFDDSMQIGPQDSQSKCRETIKKDIEVVQVGSNNTLDTHGGGEEGASDTFGCQN